MPVTGVQMRVVIVRQCVAYLTLVPSILILLSLELDFQLLPVDIVCIHVEVLLLLFTQSQPDTRLHPAFDWLNNACTQIGKCPQ